MDADARAVLADLASEWAARASRGDRAAVESLYRRFAPELYRRVILPRCGDADLADEALAETFRVVLDRIERYAPHPEGPMPWLARIAISKTMDLHRARARGHKAMTNFARLMHPLIPAVTSADSTTRYRDDEELSAAIRATLATMNERYRLAIDLRFFEELERDACAERMQVTLGNFDVILLRAVRAFRAAYEARSLEGTP